MERWEMGRMGDGKGGGWGERVEDGVKGWRMG